MGFLRKVGRKIKKGVKKLFGSKIGKILGGIGLSMMFFSGANALFGNQKWFQGLRTNLNKINPFAKGDVTGAVENVAQNIDPTLEGLKEATKLSYETLGKKATRTLTDIPFSELDIGQKIAKVGVETKDFLIPDVSSVGEFAADVTKSVGKQYAMGVIQGEPEEQFYSKGVQQVGSFEPAQSAYMAEVKTQMPNLQATNFNQLNQSLLYGTLSPQYLMGQAQYS
jgi:hypothetical protein